VFARQSAWLRRSGAIWAWREPSGQKRSKSFTRKKDADAFRNEQERKARLGELWDEPSITLAEFWDGWVERYEASVEPTSFCRRIATKRHLSTLMPLRVDEITPALVEDLVAAIAREHPRQAQYVLQTVKMLLRAAARRGQRTKTDVLALKPPTYRAPTRRFLRPQEVETIASASSESGLIRFTALTGVRWKEISGLTDAEIASDDTAIVIHREITKTRAGVRTIPLVREARVILAAQRLARPHDCAWLFPAPGGGKWGYSNFRNRVWKTAVTKTGHEGLRFHELRHTFASLMIASGCHPGVLKALMGHESIKTTLDIYGHLYPDATEAAIKALDAHLDAIDAAAAPSVPHDALSQIPQTRMGRAGLEPATLGLKVPCSTS